MTKGNVRFRGVNSQGWLIKMDVGRKTVARIGVPGASYLRCGTGIALLPTYPCPPILVRSVMYQSGSGWRQGCRESAEKQRFQRQFRAAIVSVALCRRRGPHYSVCFFHGWDLLKQDRIPRMDWTAFRSHLGFWARRFFCSLVPCIEALSSTPTTVAASFSPPL